MHDFQLDFFHNYFVTINELTKRIDAGFLERTVFAIQEARRYSRKVILVGNGGSSAMASHVSVDLTKVAGIRSVNFNEADLVTCFANDYGYENWVAKALEAYADQGDVAILISSSGRSPNIVNGALKARELGLRVVTLSGFDAENPLRTMGDVNLWCDSKVYNIVEMTHHIWLLSIVDYLADAKVS